MEIGMEIHWDWPRVKLTVTRLRRETEMGKQKEILMDLLRVRHSQMEIG
jgi:hypothetical protein